MSSLRFWVLTSLPGGLFHFILAQPSEAHVIVIFLCFWGGNCCSERSVKWQGRGSIPGPFLPQCGLLPRVYAVLWPMAPPCLHHHLPSASAPTLLSPGHSQLSLTHSLVLTPALPSPLVCFFISSLTTGCPVFCVRLPPPPVIL